MTISITSIDLRVPSEHELQGTYEMEPTEESRFVHDESSQNHELDDEANESAEVETLRVQESGERPEVGSEDEKWYDFCC